MKRMILLILLASLLSQTVLCTGHWVKTVEKFSRWYMAAAAYDSMNCAALSNFNFYVSRLELSEDGGNTWMQVFEDEDIFLDPVNRSEPIRLTKLAYPSQNLIICGGDKTWILRSTDKGDTWSRSRIDSVDEEIQRLRMYNDNFGAAITLHDLYTTTDGGISWIKFDRTPFMGYNLDFWDISTCPGADSMLIAYVYPRYYKFNFYFITKDRGKTWEYIKHNWNYYSKIFFIDSLSGWDMFNNTTIKGESIIIRKTTDGAKTWTMLIDTIISPAKKLNDFYFLNKNFGMFWGNSGRILITKDGGLTVEQEYLPDYPTGYDLSTGIILSENNRLLFSTKGDIFKYENTVGIDENYDNTHENNEVFYDAGDNTIRVPVTLTGRGSPDFTLYDIEGKMIQKFPEYLVLGSSGFLTLRIQGRELASGLYFLHIFNGEHSYFKKLIISR